MALDPKKVIEIARAEIGYLEKKSNSNLDSKTANAGSNNYTKYGRDLDALGFYNGKKNGVAWCDQFVDWCFVQAYGLETALAMTFQPLGKNNSGAGCQYSRNYYKNNGRLFNDPKPGDQIFFWNSDKSRVSHTGLVEKVSGGKVYTIEGNTSGASGVVANGGGVKAKSYSLNYNRIAGYGRPDWNAAGASGEDDAAGSGAAVAPMGGVTVAPGVWNVRVGPGTGYKSLGTAKGGRVLESVRTKGWVPVMFDGQMGWISPKAVQKGAGDGFCVTIPGVDAATAAYLLEAYAGAKAETE